MGDKSKIEWTGATWSFVTGCTPVSAGCKNCYSRDMTRRLKAMGQKKYQAGFDRVVCHPDPDLMFQPMRWKKPRNIFVCSMSDLFHEDVSDAMIMWAWYVMSQSAQHTFQVLTKRPERMRDWLSKWADTEEPDFDDPVVMARGPAEIRAKHKSGRALLFADMLDLWGDPPDGAAYPLYDWAGGIKWRDTAMINVWLGATVENQEMAERRTPVLLECPAEKRFLSCEPLLEEIDLGFGGVMPGRWQWLDSDELDWVIVGGESGSKARPMDPMWAKKIIEDCHVNNVPVFMKQMGAVWAKENCHTRKGNDPMSWPEWARVQEMPWEG